MPYNEFLAERVRIRLQQLKKFAVEEKKLFGGLAFLINGKMCINISGENLMCRFNPKLENEISQQKGYVPMVMRGRKYKGFCYVKPDGFDTQQDFENWINLCLEYNIDAKASK